MYKSINKEDNINQLNDYMFAKTLSMFEWANLPETIPQRELEKLLQKNGYAFITKVDGELYAFVGGLGGQMDAYGNPTEIIINNPYLKFNKSLNLKKDGVLMINDDMKLGLLPFYNKQSTLLVENDINMIVSGKNTRIQTLISAPDNKTKESAELYLKKIDDGETTVIGDNALFEGVKIHNASGGKASPIKDLLEYHQYLKSNLYNEVGLSSNFNMKRERLLSAEVDQSEDSLFPLVYNMLQCRLFAVEQINAMFNTDIDLDFGSVWHYKNKKLVDGVIENDNENRKLDNTDNQSVESNINQQQENGTNQQGAEIIPNDLELERERGQAPESDLEPEPELNTESEPELTNETVVENEITEDKEQNQESEDRAPQKPETEEDNGQEVEEPEIMNPEKEEDKNVAK